MPVVFSKDSPAPANQIIHTDSGLEVPLVENELDQ